MTRWLLPLALALSAAPLKAQTLADAVFDGGLGRRASWEEFLPVTFRKAPAKAAPAQSPTGQFRRVMLTLKWNSKALPALEALGFVADRSFAPSPCDAGQLATGFVPAARLSAVSAHAAVLKLLPGAEAVSEDPRLVPVLEALAASRAAVLAVPGVSGLVLGLDCGQVEEHLHIKPHQPAATVLLAPGADAAKVRAAVLAAAPGLSSVPLVLVPAGP